MTTAHWQLQKDLERKTAWGKGDTEALLTLRPRVQMWTFAEGCAFEPDAFVSFGAGDAPRLAVAAFKNSTLSHDNLLALTQLPALARLDLSGCAFKADDFAALCYALASGGSPKLSELWLANTAVGDDDLAAVGKMARLRWIVLSGTKITDTGLHHLHGLKKLETLWLDRTSITDAGVLGLAVLPKLTGLPTRETACSPDVKERLFRAQADAQKTTKAFNAAQAADADARLREFLRAMEAWERAAWSRSKAIETEFRAERPHPNQLGQNEICAHDLFWREINEQKAEIAHRFCTQALLKRGANRANSYGDPPNLEAQTGDWVLVETPSKTKTLFISKGRRDGKRRYAVKRELGEWRVDEVQWWSGGWKRDRV